MAGDRSASGAGLGASGALCMITTVFLFQTLLENFFYKASYFDEAIAALFLAGFFLLVVFGAQSYRSTVGGQNRNMQSRALLSYLSTTVKGYDAEGAVGIDEDAEVGKVLILREGRSGYALRIYRADGMLVEDYARTDAGLRPEDAQVIGETAVFDPVLTADGLLTVSCDAGKVLLHLRSEGAGT